MKEFLVTVEEIYTKTYSIKAETFDNAVKIIENCTDCTYSPIYEPDSVVINITKGER